MSVSNQSKSTTANRRLTGKRLAILLAISVMVATGLVFGGFWIHARVPTWFYWQTGLVFLNALEIIYAFAAVASSLGAFAISALLFRHRGKAPGRKSLARGLLLCLSLVLALLAAEGASALWLRRTHRASAVPAGGLRPAATRSNAARPISKDASKVSAPDIFPEALDDRTIDIAIVGESSAEGVPYNRWTSIGNILRWQLESIFPGRGISLQILAFSGHTLEMQQTQLSRLVRRPQILIIYAGHNEFSGRVDSARDTPYYLDDLAPTRWSVLVERIERYSSVCGLIRQTAEKCRVAIPPPKHGHRILVDVPAYTTAEYSAILAEFRVRLDAIVAYAERIGSIPVLISPPGNDTTFEPNRSFLPPETPRHERDAFARDFLAARSKETTDPHAAQAAYRALIARHDGFAEAHYRLAQLLERAGKWEEAYTHYRTARDCDGYPMRFPTDFQKVYHEVAAKHGCILIDGQSYFHAVGNHGLLDEHLFHDAMHPSLRGQIALSQAVLHELQARKVLGWAPDRPAPLIDPAECCKKFKINSAVWEYICTWGIMFYDLSYPLRYDQSHRLAMKEVFGQAFNRIHAGAAPESIGLANIGLPEPVPPATSEQIRGNRQPRSPHRP